MQPALSLRGSIAVCFAFACTAFGVKEGDVYRVLGERGIFFDTQAVHRAAVEGILREVDPRSRLLSPGGEPCPEYQTVEAVEEWPDGVGYLKIAGMYGGGSNVVGHLARWTADGPFGIVIDLRGAGGHDLPTVDEIAGALVDSDEALYCVVDTLGATGKTHRASGKAGAAVGQSPVILLIDKQTCDASELLAAALKGREGIILIGSATRGDSRVREKIELPGGGAALLPTGRSVPASGQEYHSVGVKPDILAACDEAYLAEPGPDKTLLGEPLTDRARLDRERTLRIGRDSALARAVDILLALKALRVERLGR